MSKAGVDLCKLFDASLAQVLDVGRRSAQANAAPSDESEVWPKFRLNRALAGIADLHAHPARGSRSQAPESLSRLPFQKEINYFPRTARSHEAGCEIAAGNNEPRQIRCNLTQVQGTVQDSEIRDCSGKAPVQFGESLNGQQ